jgi:uncharacterized protein (DUF488 family)
MNTVFTMGHSTHAIEHFVALLRAHGVTAIADVRSTPYSRMAQHFNREPLRAYLKVNGIDYVFLGAELGARSSDPACYVDGKVQYDRLAAQPEFQRGLDRIQAGAERHRIALMCAEGDPLTCHRTILVARELRNRGIAVSHIRTDGALESHEAAEERLLREEKQDKDDLFWPRHRRLAEAYKQREHEIAYDERTARGPAADEKEATR